MEIHVGCRVLFLRLLSKQITHSRLIYHIKNDRFWSGGERSYLERQCHVEVTDASASLPSRNFSSSCFPRPIRQTHAAARVSGARVGATRALLRGGGIPYQGKNVYDTDERLAEFYSQAVLEDFSSDEADVMFYNLGPKAGDVLAKDINALEEVDGVAAGPPCTPWTAGGLRKCSEDELSLLYELTCDWN